MMSVKKTMNMLPASIPSGISKMSNEARMFSQFIRPKGPEIEPTFLPGEESIMLIPPNLNAWQLGKLLDEVLS